MAYVDTVTFDGATIGATPVVAGPIAQVIGTNTYSAGLVGPVGVDSTAGGYLSLTTPSDDCTISFVFRTVGAVVGSARLATFTEITNGFFASLRAHSSGVFDITDPTSTRIGAAGPAWAVDTLYWASFSINGTGSTRTVRARVYLFATGALVWDSGDRTVTGTPTTDVVKVRTPAQSGTSGVWRHDHWRRYNSGTDVPAAPVRSGTLAGTLQALTGALSGSSVDRGALAGSLARLVGALAGRGISPATIAGQLSALTGQLTGSSLDRGAVAGDLPRLTAAFHGAPTDPALLAGQLPRLIGDLSGAVLPGEAAPDFDLYAVLEAGRWLADVEADRFAARLEPARFTAEVLP